MEILLSNRTWTQTCLRQNIAKPEDIETSKDDRFKRVALQSDLVHNHTKQDQLLRQALSQIAPEWWGDETQITINKNVVCQPHVDKNNAEYSYICFLGGYSGGDLVFETGERIDEPYRWHKINADKVLHWNEPITRGTKYSVIINMRNDRPPHNIRRGAVEPCA